MSTDGGMLRVPAFEMESVQFPGLLVDRPSAGEVYLRSGRLRRSLLRKEFSFALL